MFGADALSVLYRPIDAAKVSHIPCDAKVFREKSCDTSAEIHCFERRRDRERALLIVCSDMHEAGASDDIGTQRVLSKVSRQCNDDVSCHCRDAAVDDERLLRSLEEIQGVPDVALNAEDLAEEQGVSAEVEMRVSGGVLDESEARGAAVRGANKRLQLPLRLRRSHEAHTNEPDRQQRT